MKRDERKARPASSRTVGLELSPEQWEALRRAAKHARRDGSNAWSESYASKRDRAPRR